MKAYALTDIGRVRPINEDAYYLPHEGECFCAIADGMGGHNAGEVASAMAIRAFAEVMREEKETASELLIRGVGRANEQVYEHAREREQLSGMGTTFTALCVRGDDAYIAHVGDSRVYRIRSGSIAQLTMDHTLVAELVQRGMITPKEAQVHPKRNYITRALGAYKQVEVDLIHKKLQPGDVFLLCTDGLYNHLSEEELLAVTLGEGKWRDKLRQLVDRALEAGGSDNITALYVPVWEDNQ